MRAVACALALVLAPGVASAASYEEVASLVNVDAFPEDVEAYAKRMAIQKSECGYYGRRSNKRRALYLIEKYQVLADAVAAGDEAATMAAGEALYTAIDRNERFTKCWRHVARRSDISSRLASTLRKL